MAKEIPVYLVCGFLEAGKTHLIRELLEDPEFSEGEKTAVILCEEGEEELSDAVLEASNARQFVVESKDDFTFGYLAKLNKREEPERVIIEYNGTWSVEEFLSMMLPAGWQLAQIVVSVFGGTFDLYLNNMRQMMVNQLTYADLIIFNRCYESMPLAQYYRSIKMLNRGAMLIFEKEGGDVIEINSEDILPFNIHDEVIEIADDDFGLWYVDAMDNPKHYDGRTVHFTAMVHHEPSFPKGYFVPARMAMTCCIQDMQMLGYLCRSKVADRLKEGSWVSVTARVDIMNMELYGGEGPVLTALRLDKAEKPSQEFVYLN